MTRVGINIIGYNRENNYVGQPLDTFTPDRLAFVRECRDRLWELYGAEEDEIDAALIEEKDALGLTLFSYFFHSIVSVLEQELETRPSINSMNAVHVPLLGLRNQDLRAFRMCIPEDITDVIDSTVLRSEDMHEIIYNFEYVFNHLFAGIAEEIDMETDEGVVYSTPEYHGIYWGPEIGGVPVSEDAYAAYHGRSLGAFPGTSDWYGR